MISVSYKDLIHSLHLHINKKVSANYVSIMENYVNLET